MAYGFGKDLFYFWSLTPKGTIEKTETNRIQTFILRVDKTRIFQNSQNLRKSYFPDIR